MMNLQIIIEYKYIIKSMSSMSTDKKYLKYLLYSLLGASSLVVGYFLERAFYRGLTKLCFNFSSVSLGVSLFIFIFPHHTDRYIHSLVSS